MKIMERAKSSAVLTYYDVCNSTVNGGKNLAFVRNLMGRRAPNAG